MAKRYIGDAVVTIAYRDDNTYAGTIKAGGHTWRFNDLHPAPAGFGPGIAYDSPEAYDEMVGSAVSFGAYGGDAEWAPPEEVADAIGEATAWAQDEQGKYQVRRSAKEEAHEEVTEEAPQHGKPFQGLDYNDKVFHHVKNMLVSIVLDGVAGVSPEITSTHGSQSWRQIPPEKADEYIARGRKVLADLESQTKVPRNAKLRMEIWITELRRLLAEAEEIRSGARQQRQTPDSYDELHRYLHRTDEDGVSEAAEHHVADFNTLSDLVDHARKEGARYVVERGDEVWIIYPNPGDRRRPYLEAATWNEGGYWHAEAPPKRSLIASLPKRAITIEVWLAHRGAAPQLGGARRQTEASEHEAQDEVDYVVQGLYSDGTLTGDGEEWFALQTAAIDAARKLASSSHFEGDYTRVITRDGELVWDSRKPGRRKSTQRRRAYPPLDESAAVNDYIAVDRNDHKVAGPFRSQGEAQQHVPPGGYVKFSSVAHRKVPPAPSSYPMFRAGKKLPKMRVSPSMSNKIGHDVRDYEDNRLLGQATDNLRVESSRTETGAVPAYRDEYGTWDYVPPSEVEHYRRLGHEVVTVYVE